MEGETPRSRCCSKVFENLLIPSLSEDRWGGFYSFPRASALIKSCIEVLQRGREMEIPSTPERAAVDRSDSD